MKSQGPRILVVLLALLLDSCKNTAEKPDTGARPIALIEGIALNAEQQHRYTMLAKSGDADAAIRLANHFIMVANDEVQGVYWLQQAAQYGGKKEKEIYQSFLEARKEFLESQKETE